MSLHLGIDIAKRTFDVALLRADGKYRSKKFPNTQAGFGQLLEWLRRHEALQAHACMEATGVYGEALAGFLVEAGLRVSVVNPAQIKAFAASELSRTKTDRADAALIARFCRAMTPPPWQPLPPEVRALKALLLRLEALQAMQQQERNRLEVADAVVRPSLETVVDTLQTQIKAIKVQIRRHIDEHPQLRDKRELLKAIPGIGPASIPLVLAYFGAVIERFADVRALVAYLGLNPCQHESGSSVRHPARISHMGPALLRKGLFLPTVVACHHNPLIQAFYERLRAAGKPGKVAVIAAMRKLVHIIYGVLKSGKPFDPARHLAA